MPETRNASTSYNFSKSYNRNMLITFVILIIISTALITIRIYNNTQRELLQHIDTFRSTAIALDNLVGDITKHVDLLQLSSELYFIEKKSYNTIVMNAIKQTSHDAAYYSLDTIPPPFRAQNVGNLTGRAIFKNLAETQKTEIGMALALNPLFQATKENIPGAAWVYYTSKNSFINIYPWTHSTGFKFTDELYNHEFYTLGVPAKNSTKRLFWTTAYIDEYGKGLMVSSAKPVYRSDEFLGTVAIDITLDSLADSIKSTNESIVFVINEQEQLLAHPHLIHPDDETVKPFSDAVPESIKNKKDAIFAKRPLEKAKIGNYYVTWYQMEHAPWRVVFFMKQNYIWIKSSTTVGIVFLTLLIGLASMIYISNKMTFRDFIRPAEGLVRHIAKENENQPAEIPKVPSPWLPWFQTISATFRENRDYTYKLEGLVKERTAELEIEKEKSDNLLLNILPSSIAERLKSGEDIIADDYADVSVLFADIVGFTKLSSRINASKLVATLNKIFSTFDSIIAEHNLEKIKTIGDAYMLAGGIPVPNSTHLKRTVLAGLAMIEALARLQKHSPKKLQIRVGIHTGPLVAGVIGKSKFIYDMWGDTVNVASRMESSGVPGEINVSAEVYEKLQHEKEFEFEKREKIKIKGKGLMQSYLVRRKLDD